MVRKNKSSIETSEWTKYKAEALAQMISAARARKVLTYSEIAPHISAKWGAHDARLWDLITHVAEDEDAQNRGLISVLVVHKHGDMRPGDGFFTLAKERGYKFSNKGDFFIQHLNQVYDYWKNSTPDI